MRRSAVVNTLNVLVLLLLAGSAFGAGGAFPFVSARSGIQDGVRDGSIDVSYYQGYYENELVFFIYGNASALSCQQYTNPDLTLPTRLLRMESAIGHGANPMYVVLNYSQGPIFSSKPGNADYSGLWQVFYITWKKGAAYRPIRSVTDLPDASEATITTTNIVVDRPIVAVGRFGPTNQYRIKQALGFNMADRTVRMPVWAVYSENYTRKRPLVSYIMVADVADPGLAKLLKANLAPGLGEVMPEDAQSLYMQDENEEPIPPPFQLPILDQTNSILSTSDRAVYHNPNFTPVMDITLMERANLPLFVVVNNPIYLHHLLEPSVGGFVLTTSPGRIKGSVLQSIELAYLLGR